MTSIVRIFFLLLLHPILGEVSTGLSSIAIPPSLAAATALPSALLDISTNLQYDDDPVALCSQGVKAYRPRVFKLLRRNAGISDEEFLSALKPDSLVGISSDSKSGQCFWRSSDGRIVLKTIKAYECRTMLRILDGYALHVLTGRSAIAAVLGVYRVVSKSGKKTYFLAASNVYPAGSHPHQLRMFDLKGSLVGRRAAVSSPVAKDLDLLADKYKIDLDCARDMVLRTLTRDAEFLRRHGIRQTLSPRHKYIRLIAFCLLFSLPSFFSSCGKG
jgi:hypothetical protein